MECQKILQEIFMAKAKELLFTPFTVTRFAMHRNHACSQKTPRGMLPVNSNAKDYSYRKLVKKNCQNGKIT